MATSHTRETLDVIIKKLLMLKRFENLVGNENQNFSFRPLSMGDVPLYLKWFNDEKVRKNLWPTTPRTVEAISEFVKEKIAGGDQ